MSATTTSRLTTPRALPITVVPHADASWPQPEDPRARRTVRLVVLAVIALTAGYLLWRATVTLSPASLVLGVPLLLLEVASLTALAMAAVALWDLDAVRRPEPVARTSHRVAVVIPTSDEPYETLMPTLASATRMRLADRVVVLDDGHREWLAGMSDELGIEYRTRTARHDGTAGQINAVVPTLAADFMVVVEPDQVVEPDLIGRLLPHFDDPSVALVRPPRAYSNPDSFEHVTRGRDRVAEQADEQRLLDAGSNRAGAVAWSGGTAMLRTAALADVDGIDPRTQAHGLVTTVALNARGWRTIAHDEVLARGRAAIDYADYADRRTLEYAGGLQALRLGRLGTGTGLSLRQRLGHVSRQASALSGLRTLGYLTVAPLILLLGLSPATGPLGWFVVLLAGVFLLRLAARRLLSRGRVAHPQSALFAILQLPAALRALPTLITGRAVRPGAAGRDPRRLPVAILALLLLNAAALAWAAATAAGLTPAAYASPVITVMAVVWSAANVVLLAGAARRIRSREFGGDRRDAARIEVDGHAFLDGERVHLLDLSLTGVRALTYGRPPAPDCYCAVTFTDPARRPAVVTGTVVSVDRRPHGHEVRIRFDADQTYVLGAIMAQALVAAAPVTDPTAASSSPPMTG